MDPQARRYLEQLALLPHPEGGYYRETYRSTALLDLPSKGRRAALTVIYFLLDAPNFSAFHRVSSEETWHHYAGDPLELHLLDSDGAHTSVVLGSDFGNGERAHAVVPTGVWQAARPVGDRFSLVGCTVSPGFDFADFEMPTREKLVSLYPQHRTLLTRFTRD